MNNYELIKFKDNEFELDVNVSPEEDTVWLTKDQIALLFGRDRTVISRHINNIFKEKELDENTSVHFLHISPESINPDHRPPKYYNLDVVVAVGRKTRSQVMPIFYEWSKQIIRSLKNNIINNESNIIRFNDGNLSLDVTVSPQEDTVYLSKEQLAFLFDTTRQNIEYHIKNIYDSGELDYRATCKEILQVQIEGDREIERLKPCYNLDMIISIGYRTNTKRGIAFRKWANNVLKQYLLKGYALDRSRVIVSKESFIELEQEIKQIKCEIAEIKEKTFIEPVKLKIFYDGQYFDAYDFICSLVSSANQSIILIDSYFDEVGLHYLKKKKDNIKLCLVISDKSKLTNKDVKQFEKQYGHLEIHRTNVFHDRYLIIDEQTCYSLGASLNYMGKKVFSVNLVEDKDFIDFIMKKVEL